MFFCLKCLFLFVFIIESYEDDCKKIKAIPYHFEFSSATNLRITFKLEFEKDKINETLVLSKGYQNYTTVVPSNLIRPGKSDVTFERVITKNDNGSEFYVALRKQNGLFCTPKLFFKLLWTGNKDHTNNEIPVSEYCIKKKIKPDCKETKLALSASNHENKNWHVRENERISATCNNSKFINTFSFLRLHTNLYSTNTSTINFTVTGSSITYLYCTEIFIIQDEVNNNTEIGQITDSDKMCIINNKVKPPECDNTETSVKVLRYDKEYYQNEIYYQENETIVCRAQNLPRTSCNLIWDNSDHILEHTEKKVSILKGEQFASLELVLQKKDAAHSISCDLYCDGLKKTSKVMLLYPPTSVTNPVQSTSAPLWSLETITPSTPLPEDKVTDPTKTNERDNTKTDAPKPKRDNTKPDAPKPERDNTKPDAPKPEIDNTKTVTIVSTVAVVVTCVFVFVVCRVRKRRRERESKATAPTYAVIYGTQLDNARDSTALYADPKRNLMKRNIKIDNNEVTYAELATNEPSNARCIEKHTPYAQVIGVLVPRNN